jgi:hypothetical protein
LQASSRGKGRAAADSCIPVHPRMLSLAGYYLQQCLWYSATSW